MNNRIATHKATDAIGLPLVMLALLAVAFSANASVIYNYSGKNFAGIVDVPEVLGQYTTSMHIDASFTLSASLPANLAGVDYAGLVDAWSISDERNSMSNLTHGPLDNLYIGLQTDSVGQITSWRVSAAIFDSTASGFMNSVGLYWDPTSQQGYDQGSAQICVVSPPAGCDFYSDYGFNNYGANLQPTGWTFREVSDEVGVPEPLSSTLVCAGFIATGVTRRRRRCSAALRQTAAAFAETTA